jgi:outer membrane beta-barrel protein
VIQTARSASAKRIAFIIPAIVLSLGLLSQPALGQAKSDESDKVDLKKLEEKYWAAKDTDYNVVQNRTYNKANRPYVSLSYGPLLNDSYSTGRMSNIALGYFLSERWGVEFAYEKGDLKDNDGVTKYRDQYGVQVDYNKFQTSKSLNAIFVPMYAKMSFMDRSILYFDMQFAFGVGQVDYQIQRNIGAELKSGTSVNFDITQQLFFHNNFALRLDIKNKWSSQERQRYQLSGGQTEADRKLSTFQAQDTSILLGLTFFY